MATSLFRIILVFITFIGTVFAEPTMTKEQASKLGAVIIASPLNKKYRSVFDIKKVTYDEERSIWVFSGGFPVTPGGDIHVFELREKDGHYRLGSISTATFSKAAPKFLIAPSLRRPIKNLLEEFKMKPKIKS